MTIELAEADPVFETSYRHSVFGSTVRARYRVEGRTIRQVWEDFTQPGYGMGAIAGGDEKPTVSRRGSAQRLFLDRELPDFVLRVQNGQENRLEQPVEIDLVKELGDGPVRLNAKADCGESAGAGVRER